MAHEVDMIQAGRHAGKKAMFSVGETPWHDPDAATVVAGVATVREGLELGGMDFDVDLRPVYRVASTTEVAPGEQVHEFTESTKARVTVRTDRNTEIGAVGMDYTVLQNRDAFGILQPLLDEGVAALETGGALRGGADVWMLVRFMLDRFGPQAQDVLGNGPGGDGTIVPFGLISNNHSGRRGVLLSLTPIRVVCANTLGAAESRSEVGVDTTITIRHTMNVEAKLVEAAEQLFKGIVERYETIAKQYKLLKATHLDTALFRELVLNTVAPDPRQSPRFTPEARMADAVVARWEQKVELVTHLWTGGKGHTGDGSAWEAYQGTVEAIDHNTALFPTRSGVYRTQALLDGKLRQLKQQVLQSLVAHAAKDNDALALSA